MIDKMRLYLENCDFCDVLFCAKCEGKKCPICNKWACEDCPDNHEIHKNLIN